MATKQELLYLRAKDAYYKGSPIMTDYEFDTLETKLKRQNSSVVEMVGHESGKSMKYKHWSKMLSLSKIRLDDPEFDKKIKQFLDKVDVPHIEISPKFDGNAVNVLYEDGNFVAGLSRGDGKFGVNFTEKIRRLVPNRIPIEDKIEVRGEVLIDIPTFDEKFKSEFKNPRNFVAGVLNRDTNDVTTLNNLTFIPLDVRIYTDEGETYYSFFEHEDVDTEKYETEHDYLEKIGFTKMIGQTDFILDNKVGFESFKKELMKICEIRDNYSKHEFPYLVDGVVVKFLDYDDKKRLGENNHSPNWAMAIKLPEVEKSTIIKGIDWNVGTTGELTPIANLEPIELDGTTISRVTLHNYGWMTERKCFPGAVVKIIKSGDIIPKVVEVLKPGKYLNLDMVCPDCESQLIIDDIRLKCTNNNCKAKVLKRLKNSFSALGMDYMGSSTCELLYKTGIHDILDFLDPKFDENTLKETEHFKEGRFLERILQQYDKLDNTELSNLIIALNFNKVGKTIANKIARVYVGETVNWSGLDSEIVERFSGLFKEDSDHDSFEEKRINTIISHVEDRGYNIEYPSKTNQDTVKFEMTGSPKNHGFRSKSEFKKRLDNYNVQHTSLSNADYLIVDNKDSSSNKIEKAKKKDISIITYTEFINKF